MKAGGEPQKGRTRELDGYRIGDLGQAVAGVEGVGGGGAGNSGMQLNAVIQDLVPSIRVLFCEHGLAPDEPVARL